MKRSTLLLGLLLVLMSAAAIAQTNVRGWYADGQTRIMWDLDGGRDNATISKLREDLLSGGFRLCP
jgi:hypothetical protein